MGTITVQTIEEYLKWYGWTSIQQDGSALATRFVGDQGREFNVYLHLNENWLTATLFRREQPDNEQPDELLRRMAVINHQLKLVKVAYSDGVSILRFELPLAHLTQPFFESALDIITHYANRVFPLLESREFYVEELLDLLSANRSHVPLTH